MKEYIYNRIVNVLRNEREDLLKNCNRITEWKSGYIIKF